MKAINKMKLFAILYISTDHITLHTFSRGYIADNASIFEKRHLVWQYNLKLILLCLYISQSEHISAQILFLYLSTAPQ